MWYIQDIGYTIRRLLGTLIVLVNQSWRNTAMEACLGMHMYGNICTYTYMDGWFLSNTKSDAGQTVHRDWDWDKLGWLGTRPTMTLGHSKRRELRLDVNNNKENLLRGHVDTSHAYFNFFQFFHTSSTMVFISNTNPEQKKKSFKTDRFFILLKWMQFLRPITV